MAQLNLTLWPLAHHSVTRFQRICFAELPLIWCCIYTSNVYFDIHKYLQKNAITFLKDLRNGSFNLASQFRLPSRWKVIVIGIVNKHSQMHFALTVWLEFRFYKRQISPIIVPSTSYETKNGYPYPSISVICASLHECMNKTFHQPVFSTYHAIPFCYSFFFHNGDCISITLLYSYTYSSYQQQKKCIQKNHFILYGKRAKK